jgi:tetratricopeptide (TPR) repeat protein
VAIDKEKTLQAAQRAVEKKKFDLAIEEYRKLAVAEKNDPRWLLKIGDTQQKKGDFTAAIASYEEVARFYSAQGFHLKAVAVYNTVRELLTRQPPQVQTKYEHVPVRLAELYEKLQLMSDALATWDSIADRLQRDGRDREATDIYKRIVTLDPSNPLAHLRLAEALSRQKDIEGAIAEFAATAEQLTAQRRIDDALKVYERLLHHRQDPKYARPAAELYLARGGQNDGVAAIAKIQICLKSDPKSVELIALLARGFVAIGQNDKAVTIFKESARLAGEQQKHELRKDIAKRLQDLAPNDDGVRALVAEVAGKPPPTGPRAADAQQPAPARAAQAAPQQPQPTRAAHQQQPQPTRAAQQQPAPQPQSQARGAQQATAGRPQPALQAPNTYDLDVDEEELEDDDDVEFEEREAAEEIGDIGQNSRRGSRVAEVIANADAFRKVKLFAKALTTLRIGLELEPHSVPIRERIRDILIETGETDLAIGEMVTLAAILLEDGDLQGSYDNLAWILEAEPGHQQATALMQQLQAAAGQPAEPPPEVAEDFLTENSVVDADDLVSEESVPSIRAGSTFDELDEPATDEPLPSYDLDEPGEGTQGHNTLITDPAPGMLRDTQGIRAGSTGELPAYELDDSTASVEPIRTADPLGPGASGAWEEPPLALAQEPTAEVEAALEEADFYAAQGVFETARETIEDALRASPNNALLLEKLRELDSVARGRSVAPPPSTGPIAGGDRAFDIAASLDALDELDKVEQPKFTAAHDQVDVEEVFAKFKLGVAEQVDAADSQTHYDLGIAYEQMMLFDDAINEFRIAAKDPSREALCHSMIGMIYVKKGALADATEAFKAGLHAEQVTRDEELALVYELGNIWDMRKNYKEAVYYFKRVVAMDAKYRDARDRIVTLEKKLGPGGAEGKISDKGSGARAKNNIDDELDAAFDDVLNKRKAH